MQNYHIHFIDEPVQGHTEHLVLTDHYHRVHLVVKDHPDEMALLRAFAQANAAATLHDRHIFGNLEDPQAEQEA